MLSGAQPGNKNAAKPKLWQAALTQALERQVTTSRSGTKRALDAIADEVVALALAGDMFAVKEIADRIDGKVVTRIEASGPDGGPIEFATDAGLVRSRLAEIAAGVETGRGDRGADGCGTADVAARLAVLVAAESADTGH